MMGWRLVELVEGSWRLINKNSVSGNALATPEETEQP
jgi:hypothetical protein